MATIQQSLPPQYTCKYFGIDAPALTFDRPQLYCHGMALEPNTLYVIRTASLPAGAFPEGVGFICFGNRLPLEWLSRNCSLLLISGGDMYALLNDIHGIYSKFDQWDASLISAVFRDDAFDLKRMMCLGSAMLENPVYLLDPSLQIIAYTKVSRNADGKINVTVIDTPYFLSTEARIAIKETCHIERKLTEAFVSACNPAAHSTYCKNLFLLGHYMGCVWVEGSFHPFRENDYFLADHFFHYFANGFQKYLTGNKSENSPEVDALNSYLENGILSPDIQEVLTLEAGEHWLFFRLKEKRNRKSLPKDFLVATLNTMMQKKVVATIYSGDVVGFFRCTDADRDSSVDLFQDLLKRTDYLCGFSAPVLRLEMISDALIEASFAVECAIQGGPEETIAKFEDHILSYMLHECYGRLPVEALYRKSTQKLVAYDNQRGTEYLKTLGVYLKNECSIPKTSEQLYIHRTSLLKRLEKIQRITGDSLDDPDTRLYYRLCFALWDYGCATAPSVLF